VYVSIQYLAFHITQKPPNIPTTVLTHICAQVLVDGPADNEAEAVPRHAAGLSYMSLTGIVIPKLPRGVGHGALKKKCDEHKVVEKWQESNFAKSRERSIRRRQLSDFERFKVMRLRKQVCLYHYVWLEAVGRCVHMPPNPTDADIFGCANANWNYRPASRCARRWRLRRQAHRRGLECCYGTPPRCAHNDSVEEERASA
jgi:large subunit ribosomal protein L14e